MFWYWAALNFEQMPMQNSSRVRHEESPLTAASPPRSVSDILHRRRRMPFVSLCHEQHFRYVLLLPDGIELRRAYKI